MRPDVSSRASPSSTEENRYLCIFCFIFSLNTSIKVRQKVNCVLVEELKTNLMSLAILFHFLCAQHVSDINISIIRSLRLFCWITTTCCASACNTDTTPTQPHRISNTHRTKNNTTNVVIQQNSRKLLMMYVLMSETCWAHKKWNNITSDINFVFYSSTITMMHGPINIKINFVPLINLFSSISIFKVFEETLQSVLQCQIMFEPKDQV